MKAQHTSKSAAKLPSDAAQVLTIIKYFFLDYFRSRRFFVLLLITIAVGLLITGVVGYYRPQSFLSSDLAFLSNFWGEWVSFVIVLSAVFFGGDAISSEFQNKTGYFLVGNPIRRSTIYIGKYIAALLGSIIILLVFTAITVGNSTYYFGFGVPYEFFESFLFSIVYIISVMGLAFLFSSLFKSNSVAIIVTVILMLFVFSLIETLVANLVVTEPWFVLTYGSEIIRNILISPYPPAHTSSAHGVPFSIATYNASVPEGLIIMLAYFVVSFIAGLTIFERKEFT